MKKLMCCVMFLVSGSVMADTLGFRASGGVFDYETSGTIRDSATLSNEVDVKNDLHIADDSASTGFIYFEHPIPVIPNLRFGSTSLDLAGSGSVTKNFTFNGTSYTASTNVTTQLDLSHNEIALYYELIDIGFDFDLGLNFKLFDGRARLTDGTNTTTQDIDAVVPMLYGAINIPILNTGFHLTGDMSVISYDGNELSDVLLRVRYQTDYHFGFEAGIRTITLKIEDTTDQLYANVKVKGPYIAAYLYF